MKKVENTFFSPLQVTLEETFFYSMVACHLSVSVQNRHQAGQFFLPLKFGRVSLGAFTITIPLLMMLLISRIVRLILHLGIEKCVPFCPWSANVLYMSKIDERVMINKRDPGHQSNPFP